MTPEVGEVRRVVLLETDERAGLVAALALACAAQRLSLEITTGPGHVLLTLTAADRTLDTLRPVLEAVPGVIRVHLYTVAEPQTAYP